MGAVSRLLWQGDTARWRRPGRAISYDALAHAVGPEDEHEQGVDLHHPEGLGGSAPTALCFQHVVAGLDHLDTEPLDNAEQIVVVLERDLRQGHRLLGREEDLSGEHGAGPVERTLLLGTPRARTGR